MTEFGLEGNLRVAALFGFIRMITPIPYKPNGPRCVSSPTWTGIAVHQKGNPGKGTVYSYRSNHRRAGSPVLL